MKAALVVVILLAGCSTPAQSTQDAELGRIEGVVVDDTIRPVPGATVRLLPTDNVTQADAQGRFAFHNVTPGTYFVEAEAPGHRSAQVQVDLLDVARPKVVIGRDLPPRPYHTTAQLVAVHYLTAPGVGAMSDHPLNVVVDRPFETVVIDADWSPSQLVLDPISEAPYYHRIYAEDDGWSHEGHTGTPAHAAYTGKGWPATSDDLYLHTYPDNTGVVAMDGRADVFVTLFYNGPAPDGWSMFT